jgi:hypothetical protein
LCGQIGGADKGQYSVFVNRKLLSDSNVASKQIDDVNLFELKTSSFPFSMEGGYLP